MTEGEPRPKDNSMIKLNTWYDGLAPGFKRCYFYKNKTQYIGVEYDIVRDSWYSDFWDQEVIRREDVASFDADDKTSSAIKHGVVSNLFDNVQYLL